MDVMERNNVKTKRILDSVHGYVQIPEYYVDNIIDTIQFQRFRRISKPLVVHYFLVRGMIVLFIL